MKLEEKTMLRKVLGAILGLAFLAFAIYMAKNLIDANQRPVRTVPKTIKTVYTKTVQNGEVPITVKANGNLVASRKIELYSEVQGIFKEGQKPFKAGQFYKQGELLLDIDSREFYTTLLAQRSTLFDLITGMMPDLKFDYPEAFKSWESYLQAFDLEENLKPLPEPKSDKEKYFVNGRQIVSTFYNIKNLEERYAKYQIRAPFDGILTEAPLNPGTLIRSGQQLGEFVSTKDFELEVDVNQEYLEIMKVGEPVTLTDLSGEKEWQGKVRRVNGRLDQTTQTVKVYIGVQGKELIEGMYLEAQIAAISEQDAIEIPRSLLINNQQVYAVEDNTLITKEVIPVYFTEKTAVVKGLIDGTEMVNRPVAGAYSGMEVKMISNSSNITQ